MRKVELECPPTLKPQQFAKKWVNEHCNKETLLVKVNNRQNIARTHTNTITREYYYLFRDGKLLLGHVPGMDRLFTDDTFEHMIFRAKFKKLRPKRLQRILEVKQQVEVCGE